MANLNIKSFSDFFRLIVGKYNKELPEIDPTIKASFGRATSVGAASAAVGIQEGIEDAVNQIFWQTADDDFLELIGNYDKTIRLGSQSAVGFCAVGGTLGTLVPVDEELTSNGLIYKSLADSFVQIFTDSITLTLSGGIVTAVTSAIHSLSSNLEVTISGAVQTDYNGTYDITVLDENTFTYEITATGLSSDTGVFESTYVLINVQSADTGDITNILAGGQLSISVTNIDSTAYVGVDGVTGGLEQEEIEDYRERIGENHSLTPGVSTPPSLVSSAKSIAGNTRVFIIRPEVDDITGEPVIGGTRGLAGYLPLLGESVMYVLRDDDPSIIPNTIKLTETKDKIISDGHWPSFIPDGNLFVIAPILKQQDFIFTAISPNTTTMQNAIREQLVSFFEDNAEVGGTENYSDIELDEINSFLRQVQDPSTGQFLVSFTYTTPSAAIVSNDGEIYSMGTGTF